MSNKTLGILALIGAPCLLLATSMEFSNQSFLSGWLPSLCGIFYISGWMCSAFVIRREGWMGTKRFGRVLSLLLLASLAFVNISIMIVLVTPNDLPFYYYYFDFFWPVSNILMFIAGITIIAVNKISGWRKYVPLLVGCWLPLAMLFKHSTSLLSFIFGGFYTAVAWSVLAIAVMTFESLKKPKAATLKLVDDNVLDFNHELNMRVV